MTLTKSEIYHRLVVHDRQREKPPVDPFEKAVQDFLSLVNQRERYYVRSPDKALTRTRELMLYLLPNERGIQILQTVFDRAKIYRPSNNPDHKSAELYLEEGAIPKEGTECLVIELPAYSERSLELHPHPEDLIEHKFSLQDGLVVPTSRPSWLFRELFLQPNQIHASEKGEHHSIRNAAPNKILVVDSIYRLM